MTGYFGTQKQQQLQARTEAGAAFASATPGACRAGRFMGCDDPDRLGWELIGEFIDRDGICGLRLIPAARVTDIKARRAELKCRFDTWDVFLANRATALAASKTIRSRGLPDGIEELAMPTDPEGDAMADIQGLMGAAGIVPFSGSMLASALGPATTVAFRDRDGNVIAAAHGYQPHNVHSVHHGHAWGGLVAVAEAHRGKSLSTSINARMVVSVFRDLEASHIYELVSATNVPSRRMVEACGLRLDPGLVCGIAMPHEGERFTR
jgi:hypothetical protein